jgi:hypothetical protein
LAFVVAVPVVPFLGPDSTANATAVLERGPQLFEKSAVTVAVDPMVCVWVGGLRVRVVPEHGA